MADPVPAVARGRDTRARCRRQHEHRRTEFAHRPAESLLKMTMRRAILRHGGRARVVSLSVLETASPVEDSGRKLFRLARTAEPPSANGRRARKSFRPSQLAAHSGLLPRFSQASVPVRCWARRNLFQLRV